MSYRTYSYRAPPCRHRGSRRQLSPNGDRESRTSRCMLETIRQNNQIRTYGPCRQTATRRKNADVRASRTADACAVSATQYPHRAYGVPGSALRCRATATCGEPGSNAFWMTGGDEGHCRSPSHRPGDGEARDHERSQDGMGRTDPARFEGAGSFWRGCGPFPGPQFNSARRGDKPAHIRHRREGMPGMKPAHAWERQDDSASSSPRRAGPRAPCMQARTAGKRASRLAERAGARFDPKERRMRPCRCRGRLRATREPDGSAGAGQRPLPKAQADSAVREIGCNASNPPIQGRSASGTVTLPSAFW